tara:strand:+ start:80 stop:244 length:165 start_codon:yes stop_codon:yes gene_type:complete
LEQREERGHETKKKASSSFILVSDVPCRANPNVTSDYDEDFDHPYSSYPAFSLM